MYIRVLKNQVENMKLKGGGGCTVVTPYASSRTYRV